jgi:hypothetical protein
VLLDVFFSEAIKVPEMVADSSSVTQCSPLHAVAELEEEALVVLLGGADEALDEVLALLHAEPLDVHLLDAGAGRVPRREDDALAHAVVGGQLLDGRPPQRLLVVLLPRRPPERVAPAGRPPRRRRPPHAPAGDAPHPH